MQRKLYISVITLILLVQGIDGQVLIRTSKLVNGGDDFNSGRVEINQDIRIDSLLSRHIEANRLYNGFDGFRIQIYRGSGRDARDLANESKTDFLEKFEGYIAYLQFDPPNYFKVRVGDYRTKHDAYADFIKIKKEFPNAYIVNDKIHFPDLQK